ALPARPRRALRAAAGSGPVAGSPPHGADARAPVEAAAELGTEVEHRVVRVDLDPVELEQAGGGLVQARLAGAGDPEACFADELHVAAPVQPGRVAERGHLPSEPLLQLVLRGGDLLARPGLVDD